MSDPWDRELIGEGASFEPDFAGAFSRLTRTGVVAVAGKELMQARFTSEEQISATYVVEELRRIKSPDEIERIRQAADDRHATDKTGHRQNRPRIARKNTESGFIEVSQKHPCSSVSSVAGRS